jgi:carnitine-CoA ligase
MDDGCRDHGRRWLFAPVTGPAISPADARHVFDEELAPERQTLPALWRSRVLESGPRDFLWYPERGYQTYSDVDLHASVIRRRLVAEGIGGGRRVAMLMRNSPEMLALMLATWSLGAVVVPLNFQFIGTLLADLIRRVDPALLVIDSVGSERVAGELKEQLGTRLWTKEGSLAAQDSDAGPLEIAACDPWDLALIIFTSGSTGPSKGCLMTHRYCAYYGWIFWRYMQYTDRDVLFTSLPLYHTHALFASTWPAIHAGGRLALAPRFSASGFVGQLVESRATAFGAMGSMASMLLAQPKNDLENQLTVRIAQIAPCPPQRIEFEKRFGLRIMSTAYGLTEAVVFPPRPHETPVPGKLGREAPDFELAIVDEHLRVLPDGTAGELVVRPRFPGIMFDGYHDEPEATAKAFRGLWFHTGDICKRDEQGYYWFVGRSRDVIRRRGENVSTFELETVLAEHADVKELAAVGIPSPLGDENIVVVVVPRQGSPLTAEQFGAWADDVLPRHMRPDLIHIRADELPKTPTGKIDKSALAEHFGTD